MASEETTAWVAIYVPTFNVAETTAAVTTCAPEPATVPVFGTNVNQLLAPIP